MKKLTAILLIVAMMLTLGACSKKSDDADDSIKIGVMSTRTGENSLWGDVIYQTVQLLADDVNENGGLLGGRKIEILSYDNRDDVVETTNVHAKPFSMTAFVRSLAAKLLLPRSRWSMWQRSIKCLSFPPWPQTPRSP